MNKSMSVERNICNSWVESLKIDGYLLIPGALSTSVIGLLTNALADAHRRVAIHNKLETIIPRIVELHPIFFDLAMNSLAISIVESLLGIDAHLVINQGHIKPPRTASHTRVHSDLLHLRGVPHHLSTLMIKFMYILSDISTGDGGLRVYPGSHATSFDEYPPNVENLKSVYIEAKAGDLIVFNANLLHTATNNDSDRPRITLMYAYAHSWMRVFKGFEVSEGLIKAIKESNNSLADQIFGLSVPYTTYASVSISSK